MVVALYDRYVALPKIIKELNDELKGFIENYSHPCIDAWDGFHVHVATRLKNHYSFKHKYTISNMCLVGYNKRLYSTIANIALMMLGYFTLLKCLVKYSLEG